MNLGSFLASLGAAILAKLSSAGASFLGGLATIGMHFTADERDIGGKVLDKFHSTLAAGLAAGKSEIDAIEDAATAAYNEFCADEKVEFALEASAIITLAKSSAASAAGIVKAAVTG